MYHYEKPFSKLEDLGLQRTKMQAVGFYIAYLILGMILGAISGILYVKFTGNEDTDKIIKFSGNLAVAYCIILSLLIAFYKDILSSPRALVTVILAGVTSYFAGCLGGLLPVTYLSTFRNEYSPHGENDSEAEDR